MKVKLKGKTRHGKNRVSQHGDLWEVVRWVDEKEVGKGKCSTCVKWGQDGRWVSERMDDNFNIIEEIE